MRGLLNICLSDFYKIFLLSLTFYYGNAWSDRRWAQKEIQEEEEKAEKSLEYLNSNQANHSKLTVIIVTMVIYLVLILFLSILAYFIWRTAAKILKRKRMQMFRQELSEISSYPGKNLEKYPVMSLDSSKVEIFDE